MSDAVTAFCVEALAEMNFDVEGVGADTVLGPAGLDLDSLAVAELAVRIGDEFGVTFGEEDLEGFAALTLGVVVAEITRRSGGAVPAHRGRT